ncbi:hypothetical protein Y032_0011g1417 [Ancylostoma ceylanicum]|uniref:Sodium:neurotransmitter symporter family protein n=1 Tax=Ancylostoma ceylanicum TaxID=53326 RepID=A0A016VEW1_9BILA|nr:hypothetical protein Y032_0011g1417 [Ancylostoma ceylanicum]
MNVGDSRPYDKDDNDHRISTKSGTRSTPTHDPNPSVMETEIIDVLMFCGLTLSSLSLWVFPVKIALHGGVVFIVLYVLVTILVAFPILHLEIFVGQRHQTGICKTFQSYGKAFEGFGAAIFFLTFILSVQTIQDSYLHFVHTKNVLFFSKEIMSCRRYRERASCASIYDDSQCRLRYGPHFRYHNETCIDHDNTTTRSPTVAEKYCRSLDTSSPYDFDMQRLILYFALFCTIATISMGGLKAIRIVLAFAYALFLTTFLITVMYFPTLAKIGDVINALWSVTTWKSLAYFETYSETLHLVFNSCGVALWGVMSAASLRSRNASSCKLALAMVANNLLVSFLSTALAFSIVVAFKNKNPSALDYGLQKGEFMYVFGVLTEVMMYEMNSPIWVFVNSIANLLAKVLRIFAPVIIVCVAIRDYAPARHQLSYTFAATVSVCAAGYVLTWTRCYQSPSAQLSLGITLKTTVFLSISTFNPTIQSFRSYFAHLFTELYAAYYLLMVAGIVFVFIHIYDVREYVIDLCELYPDDRLRPLPVRLMNSTCYTFYDSIILICLIVAMVELVNASKEREETSLLLIFADRVATTAPILIVVVYFLVSLNKAHRIKQYWTLFSITSEHPSFERIHLLGDYASKRETIDVPAFLLAAGLQAKEKVTCMNSVPLIDSVMTTDGGALLSKSETSLVTRMRLKTRSSTNIFMRALSRVSSSHSIVDTLLSSIERVRRTTRRSPVTPASGRRSIGNMVRIFKKLVGRTPMEGNWEQQPGQVEQGISKPSEQRTKLIPRLPTQLASTQASSLEAVHVTPPKPAEIQEDMPTHTSSTQASSERSSPTQSSFTDAETSTGMPLANPETRRVPTPALSSSSRGTTPRAEIPYSSPIPTDLMGRSVLMKTTPKSPTIIKSTTIEPTVKTSANQDSAAGNK